MTICPGCHGLVAAYDRAAPSFGGRHERCAKNKLGRIIADFPEVNTRFRPRVASATSIAQLKAVAEEVLQAVMALPASVVGTAIASLDRWYGDFVGEQAPISAVNGRSAAEARRPRPLTGTQPAAQA